MKISVRVHASSSQEKIIGPPYEVWTKQKPLEGKATKAVLKMISKHFNLPTSRVSLISGSNSKTKVFEVDI